MGSIRRAVLPVFSEDYCKCSNALFTSVKAGLEIVENGLLSGSERRKRSLAALRWISLMNFGKTDSVPSLFPEEVQKLFRKTFSSSFDISSVGFENLVSPGIASHSVTLR